MKILIIILILCFSLPLEVQANNTIRTEKKIKKRWGPAIFKNMTPQQRVINGIGLVVMVGITLKIMVAIIEAFKITAI